MTSSKLKFYLFFFAKNIQNTKWRRRYLCNNRISQLNKSVILNIGWKMTVFTYIRMFVPRCTVDALPSNCNCRAPRCCRWRYYWYNKRSRWFFFTSLELLFFKVFVDKKRTLFTGERQHTKCSEILQRMKTAVETNTGVEGLFTQKWTWISSTTTIAA